MCRVKNIVLLLAMSFSIYCFGQKAKEKETVYLLFDTSAKEKCVVEDGSGNARSLNKYRKEFEKNLMYLHICNEYFAFNTMKKQQDTISKSFLNNIKFVDLAYIKDKKSKNIMRYNPFKKIYLVEIISEEKIIKYDVTWIDDWVMTRN